MTGVLEAHTGGASWAARSLPAGLHPVGVPTRVSAPSPDPDLFQPPAPRRLLPAPRGDEGPGCRVTRDPGRFPGPAGRGPRRMRGGRTEDRKEGREAVAQVSLGGGGGGDAAGAGTMNPR